MSLWRLNGQLTGLDCIRYYQAAQMFDKHKMFKLITFKDGLSKSFENQILATCVS